MNSSFDLTPEAKALNADWTPKPGDEAWFTKSMSRCVITIIHQDGTFTVRKLNGKSLSATRAGLIPLGAFTSE